jgi:hypothetical protein
MSAHTLAAAALLLLMLLPAAFAVPPEAKCRTSADPSLHSCPCLLVAAASGF